MKWFKHMTNASRDEKMQLLKAECGLEGYGAYWAILEVLAEQIKDSEKDFCEYPIKFWQNFLGFSPKKLRNFLGILAKFEIFSIEFSQNMVTIRNTKIKTIRDEYTEKKTQKIGTNSRQTPDSLKDKDKDKDKEYKKEKNKKEKSFVGDSPDSENFKKNEIAEEFAQWYANYPNKKARAHAEKAFITARKKTDLQTLIDGVERYKKIKPEYAAWRHPATWLNGEGWLDEAPSQAGQPPGVSKRDQVIQALTKGQALKHALLGIVDPSRITPVDAGYKQVELDRATQLQVDGGNAYPVQHFSTA